MTMEPDRETCGLRLSPGCRGRGGHIDCQPAANMPIRGGNNLDSEAVRALEMGTERDRGPSRGQPGVRQSKVDTG